MLLTLVALQASVTFAGPTDCAARLLPKLGAAMGLRLEANRQAGRQVLLVRVDGMGRDRLLSLVAETTGGTWEKIEGGYRLMLGSEELRKLRREEDSGREVWIARALAGEPGGLLSPIPKPQLGAVREIVRLVGARALSELRANERAVWSTAPTRLQRRLDPSAPALASGAVRIKRDEYERYERGGGTLPPSTMANLSKPVARVVLSARRARYSGDLALALAAYAADGVRVWDVSRCRIARPEPPSPTGLLARLPERKTEFSEGALAWAGRMNGQTELDRRMLHPETAEPLGLGVGPAVETIARAVGTDLVACLPDAAYGVKAARHVGEGLSKAWARHLPFLGIGGRIEEGTLVLKPLDEATSVEERIDRANLRRRIADVERDGHLNYRYSVPYGLEWNHLTALSPSLYEDLYYWEWPWTLPLAWQTLTPDQQRAALGSGLALRSVPRFVAALAESFSGSTPVEEDEYVRAPEPTEMFASSEILEGVLRAKFVDRTVATIRPPGEAAPTTSDLAGLAARIVKGPVGLPPGTQYWPGVERELRLFIGLGFGDSVVEVGFKLTTRSASAPSTSPTFFPALREAVDRARSSGSGGSSAGG